MIRISPLSWETRSLGPHLDAISAVIAAQTGTVSPSLRDGPAHGHNVGSSSVYIGAALEPNFGLVVFAPSGRATIDTYDPATETLAVGPAHGEGSTAFSGITLAHARLMVLTPQNSTHVGLYDPLARTYQPGPLHGAGTGAFTGGALTASGLVVMAPASSTKIGIYNTATSTFRLGPDSPLVSGFTGVQALDGDWVLMTPAGNQLPYRYNAVTDELVSVGSTISSTRGMTMLQDARVALTPHNLTRFGIYSRQTDTIALMADAISSDSSKWWGSALAGNGDVVAAPYNYGSSATFTPSSLSYSAGPTVTGTQQFAGAIALPNGDHLWVPARATNIKLYRHLSGGQALPRDQLLSRFWNKAF